MTQWNDRVALVTGGGSGIGRATALAFADEGARVMVCDVHAENGEETARMIRARGKQAEFTAADVSRAEEVEHLVHQTVKHFGRLDFAFNNAGVAGALAGTADCTEENWDRVLGTNLKGIWLCLKYELKHMLERGSGAIVNCASVAGLVGFPGMPAYVASKHGVVGLTRAAALECAGRGIRINAVCPGAIHTPMLDRLLQEHPELPLTSLVPVGRAGSPEEIASSVVWLCSDRASLVVGQAFAVDGGWTAQ